MELTSTEPCELPDMRDRKITCGFPKGHDGSHSFGTPREDRQAEAREWLKVARGGDVNRVESTKFGSRLEAQWAALFEVCDLKWEYRPANFEIIRCKTYTNLHGQEEQGRVFDDEPGEPVDLQGHTPEFKFTIPCSREDCEGGHEFFVQVRDYQHIEQFNNHPYWDWFCQWAYFGIDLSVTRLTVICGDGGGEFDLMSFSDCTWDDWAAAVATVKSLKGAQYVKDCPRHECSGVLIPRKASGGTFLGCSEWPFCKHSESRWPSLRMSG